MAKPKTLQEAIQHFSDEQVCIDAVARLRLAMKGYDLGTKLGGKDDGGAVEVDEAFFSPKPKNMHRDKRERYARENQRPDGSIGETVVIGMLDRSPSEI